jgi:hypothetical protein
MFASGLSSMMACLSESLRGNEGRGKGRGGGRDGRGLGRERRERR